MENENEKLLLLDEEFAPILITEECEEVKPVLKDFISCYIENKDIPVEEWLGNKMQEYLPNKNPEEIRTMVMEITDTLEVDESKKLSLMDAVENGRSKENWFASETQKATSAMSVQKASEYLKGLDDALQKANKSLTATITTKAGVVSRNPRLDGFIAEQHHVQTFNLNAEATGSSYRAKVLEPTGKGYAKNSVDIVIVDANGKVVRRYQAKYYKNARATVKAFERGDYRGQQKLVPEGQQGEISKKATTVIEAPDGTTSNPLSKTRAEQMRDEAQSGNWNELNWNEYKTKDLAKGIGKQAGYAALQGAAISVGVDVAQKLWNGEEINGEEVIETALVGGADFGVKAATAGAIKVGVEKEVIKVIPKGTAAGTIANIAFVAVENAKVAGKIATGELSVREGIEKIEQTTVSTTAGLMATGQGTKIGAQIGMVLGPVGAAVGGFVGGTVGYMAGTKVGEKIVKGAQKIRNGATKVISSIASGVKNATSAVTSGIKSAFRGFASIFGF